MKNIDYELAKLIDHTNIDPFITREDLLKLSKERDEYGFRSICVSNASYKKIASLGIKGNVCFLIGHPLGLQSTKEKCMKISEIKFAVKNPLEFDVVMNIGDLKGGRYNKVLNELRDVCDTAGILSTVVKVIIETPSLTGQEIITATAICYRSGASFIKTGTGFFGPTHPRHVSWIDQAIAFLDKTDDWGDPDIGIKVSGGVQTHSQAKLYVDDLSITRPLILGCSGSLNVIKIGKGELPIKYVNPFTGSIKDA